MTEQDKDKQYQIFKNKALAYLARREYAVAELKQKLLASSKATEADTIASHQALVDKVIDEMCALNYLSDTRYAAMLVRSRYNKGHGPLRVRQEFSQQRLDSTLCAQAFDDFEGDWFERAKEVLHKRFSTAPADYKERAKYMRFLASRGFSQDQIAYALSAYADQGEGDDSFVEHDDWL